MNDQHSEGSLEERREEKRRGEKRREEKRREEEERRNFTVSPVGGSGHALD